ncbi:MAG: TetR family transcriptional regulator [Micrococcales bacterium]|nr:TetR family transcriptional regulator [Micrococcales bacterium]
MTPRGRRPGGEDTRAHIVEVARTEFAAHGYDRTSLRGVARAAGVDPALVHHYFDGKTDLFTAAMTLPIRPAEIVARVTAAEPGQVGASVVRTFLTMWDEPSRHERMLAVVRSAMSDEPAARMLREFLDQAVAGPIAEFYAPEGERNAVGASLTAATLTGIAIGRYLVRFEGLPDASVEELIERVGPAIQGYLGPRRPHAEADQG